VEDSFRGKTTSALRASLGDITRNTDGSYTVPLKFTGDRVVNTTWVSEFGIWKLDKAGDLVTGDKTLVAAREKKNAQDRAKGDYDNFLMLSAGYIQIFDHKIGEEYDGLNDLNEPAYKAVTESAPALDIAILYSQARYALYRVNFNLAEDFWQFDVNIGFKVPIDIKAVTIAPFATAGIGLAMYSGEVGDTLTDPSPSSLPLAVMPLQGGLMLTTTWVPGLYLLASYQYNLALWDLISSTKIQADAQMFKINLGYAFAF
jgi:hypothetical protein